MLPLKDNIPTDRLPIVTLLLIAAGVVAQLLADGGGALALLLSALFLWLFGVSVEDAMSRPRFLALWLLGAGAAVALALALDPDGAIAAAAVAGGTAVVLGGYARLYPRARIVTLVPVPTAFTLFELPAWALLGLWFALQAVFVSVAPLVAFPLGLLAIRLFAQRRKQVPPPPSAIPAWS